MSERKTRKRMFPLPFGRCRLKVLAYCLLAVLPCFDSALLSQLAVASNALSSQPAEDDDGDEADEPVDEAAILPAERAISLTIARLHYATVPNHLSHSPPVHPSRPLAGPVCEHEFRNGVGAPLLC
jgi:hypothetical protein